MAKHPLQVAADKFVLPMADVVLDSVGAARDAVDMARLESALARRDADGAWFALEAAVNAADAVLRGDKAQKADGDTPGLGDIIAATVTAGGNAVELCVTGESVKVEPHDCPPALAARAKDAIDAELQRLSDEYGIRLNIENVRLFAEQGLTRDPSTGEIVGTPRGGSNGVFDPSRKSVTLALGRERFAPSALTNGPDSWHVDESVHGTMRHEFGHAVFDTLDGRQMSEWYAIHNKIHPEGVTPISQYGRTNAHESFAEMWSAYTHPDYKDQFFYIPDAVDFFDRTFTKRK